MEKEKSLLERIYNGEFYPGEKTLSTDHEYFHLSRMQSDEIKYISGRLSDEDKVRFEKLINLMGETERMESYANFAYGFRTGMLLIHELLASEDKTLCHGN